jgi:hypothetical protein
MPMVKWFLGLSREISRNTAAAIPGVNSLDESPYRPPTIRGRRAKGAVPSATDSSRAATTSR